MSDYRRGVRLAGLVTVLALAGCGAATSDRSGSQTPAPGGSSMSGGRTDLTIRVDDGRGTKTTWHLTCDPDGGDHPDPAKACDALRKGAARWLPEVSKDLACIEIYGGPETARVTGTWEGTAVDATFWRTDGCQIARWSGLSGLLPSGGL